MLQPKTKRDLVNPKDSGFSWSLKFYSGEIQARLIEIIKVSPYAIRKSYETIMYFLWKFREYPENYPEPLSDYFDRVCLFFQTLMKKGKDGENAGFWKKMLELTKKDQNSEQMLMILVKNKYKQKPVIAAQERTFQGPAPIMNEPTPIPYEPTPNPIPEEIEPETAPALSVEDDALIKIEEIEDDPAEDKIVPTEDKIVHEEVDQVKAQDDQAEDKIVPTEDKIVHEEVYQVKAQDDQALKTVTEAAGEKGRHAATIRKWATEGRLNFVRNGWKIWIIVDDKYSAIEPSQNAKIMKELEELREENARLRKQVETLQLEFSWMLPAKEEETFPCRQ